MTPSPAAATADVVVVVVVAMVSQMGKKINVLADSGDCSKIRVKLRCKSNLPHYRLVGHGDIHLQDVPVINSVQDAAAAAAAGSTMGDIWVPIVQSRKGETHQVGALLVNVLQTSIA